MAYMEEIQEWLMSENITWDQITAMWEECCKVNVKCQKLEECGRTWYNLPLSQIKKIPTLKEETLRCQKEMAQKQQESKQKSKLSYEEEILYKIDNHISFSERELRSLLDFEISRTAGENRRWTRSVESIIEINGRTFCLNWEEGLTESQENEFYNQPYEVQKHEYEKVITVTEWLRI